MGNPKSRLAGITNVLVDATGDDIFMPFLRWCLYHTGENNYPIQINENGCTCKTSLWKSRVVIDVSTVIIQPDFSS